MNIRIKRIYEAPEQQDGVRILVDRLWPRGISKEKAGLDLWLKDIAPSDALRRRFRHDPSKWTEFKSSYFDELNANPEGVAELLGRVRSTGTVTLLYASKETRFNNAAALKEYLESMP